ncbi:NACHT domain-containing NTPase [Microbacterium sp. MYb66]|uniref:NACHT domain-containing protein n=1 Tax=Microbacterium sp. MYb66 TaxID=1848692 RepID=UPI000CFFC4EC|nr:NACHT domain-containing protein [Microbacterium sp. MYb66]PRA78925.1 hypothetical protein CQ045_16680 [Microbacterium sp. MYb66]
MDQFTPTSLPSAVAKVFELNHHSVEGPIKIHGAEIDLVATPVGNPFAPKVYIEVTVEYVNTAKYGKDLTKLAMIHVKDPGATCLIVSSTGFTADVRERAAEARIQTLTYDELFERFEKFQPYVEMYLGESSRANEIRELVDVYERPTFSDSHGEHDALDWMNEWVSDSSAENSWLLIVGEYGTGKSALTKMLQHGWLRKYRENPVAPIPVRIELGDFTKQLDAQGLLHHFLDHNGLGHVPIEFFWSLIRAGRVVLILDGYDEMAQYLSQRERRSTLRALAELSSDGVRGILTSRPNYFSESEELSLFDHLYREISIRSKYAAEARDEIAERENEIDSLIQRSILDRFERALQDLSPDQSRALVDSILREKVDAANIVKKVLDRVFRSTGEGAEIALSGKPVIISYLIEVATSLHDSDVVRLTEWDVYTLIVDKLGLRDLEQTTRVGMDERRQFLQRLAVHMATNGRREVDEESFRDLVETVFARQVKKYTGNARVVEVDGLFEDLRRSGTLTRSEDRSGLGWRFSHNSLKEFLVAESLIDDLKKGNALVSTPPVSDAMRAFAASSDVSSDVLLRSLSAAWADIASNPAVGTYVSLVWDVLPTQSGSESRLSSIAGSPVRVQGVQLASIALSTAERPSSFPSGNFRNCVLLDVTLQAAHLGGADFSGSLLEAVVFDDAELTGVTFDEAVLVDVSISRAMLDGASFLGVNSDLSLLVDTRDGIRRVEGKSAIGLLAYLGARTDEIEPYFVWMHHPKFSIVEKISSKILEGGLRQRRGLEQRGAAAADTKYARAFVRHLETTGLIATPLGRTDLVEITSEGRTQLALIQSGRGLPEAVLNFLNEA